MQIKPTLQTAVFFILLTFLITWGINVPLALAAHHKIKFSVPRWIEITSTLSPGIVAICLTAITQGKTGLKTLLVKLFQWRVSIKLCLFALLVPALCVIPSLLVYHFVLHQTVDMTEWYLPFILFFIFIPFSPLWEEIGWRGFLLPIFQSRYSPITSAIILGLIWGVWHIPMYLTHNPEGNRTELFLVYFIAGTLPLTVLFVWLYNAARGSVLITIIFHSAINATFSLFAKVPTGELRPFIFTMVFFTLLAAAIAWHTKGKLGFKEGLSALAVQ